MWLVEHVAEHERAAKQEELCVDFCAAVDQLEKTTNVYFKKRNEQTPFTFQGRFRALSAYRRPSASRPTALHRAVVVVFQNEKK